jgi:hypothetical protein
VRHGRTNAVERAREVHGEHALPLVVAVQVHRLRHAGARVVEQDRQPAEVGGRRVDGRRERGGVGHVRRVRARADLRRGLPCPVAVYVDDGDRRALRRHPRRRGPADARRASRHERAATGEQRVHGM